MRHLEGKGKWVGVYMGLAGGRCGVGVCVSRRGTEGSGRGVGSNVRLEGGGVELEQTWDWERGGKELEQTWDWEGLGVELE